MSAGGDVQGQPISVAITGATGRMGEELRELAADRDDLTVVLAVSRSGGDIGDKVEDASGLPSLLADRDPDVLVDFTGPDSSVEYVAACVEAEIPVVVGTTGFSDEQEAALEDAGESVALLKAANFSRGIAGLRRAVREAVSALPGYDIEVTETHHNGKRDAPSGTANTILDDIEAERETDSRVHGREGDQPREAGEIGVHARRAGDVTGEHEVLLAGNHEVLSVTHRAGSRGVFAAGALDAAVWLAGREAGQYDFSDVIGGSDER